MIKDLVFLILSYLDDDDIISFFSTNKYFYKLGKDETFWRNLLIKRYGFHLECVSMEDIKNKYLNGRTWKEYYFIYYKSKFQKLHHNGNKVSYFSLDRKGRDVGLDITKYLGKIISLKHYIKGKCDGMQEEWTNDGKKISEGVFKNGYKHGTFKKWKKDILISEENYAFDLKHGISKKWYEDGNIKEYHYFCKGKPNGEVLGWYRHKQIQYYRFFDEGKVIFDFKWDIEGNERFIGENNNEYIIKNGIGIKLTTYQKELFKEFL